MVEAWLGKGSTTVTLCAVVLALAGSATAAAETLHVEMIVSHISDAPGRIDPRGAKIDAKLKHDFRYESLRVLGVKKSKLALGDVASIGLPDGRKARVRTVSIDGDGALVAVDIEGAVQVDARVKSGHLLVFGAGRHDGGRLVVSIELKF